ncbi:MAG TPA: glycoside hydrolase family 57 protein [Candidatus Binatia bacterium]|jgi:alpha-amylase
MTRLCLYFQLHQPRRLRRMRVFDIGKTAAAVRGAARAQLASSWFDAELDRSILDGIVERCYRPATTVLLSQARRADAPLRVAFGLTSTLLAQLEEAAPDVIDNIGELVACGSAEILGETSHHSLAWLLDTDEFEEQVELHREAIHSRFGVRPVVFRNTELLFDDALAIWLSARGYRAVLTEGADRILAGRTATGIYASALAPQLRVLLRHYRLSDDVGFRFGHAEGGKPLRAETWAAWVAATGGQSVNVFLDFETFGEHHGAASLDFLAALPAAVARAGISMHLPREAALLPVAGPVCADGVISWADQSRDESAWLGNAMQRAACEHLYELLPQVKGAQDSGLLEAWRSLAGSDHAYYMSTKGFGDGEVHAHFRPYESPYEAHLNFMNVLADLALQLESDVAGQQRRRAA